MTKGKSSNSIPQNNSAPKSSNNVQTTSAKGNKSVVTNISKSNIKNNDGSISGTKINIERVTTSVKPSVGSKQVIKEGSFSMQRESIKNVDGQSSKKAENNVIIKTVNSTKQQSGEGWTTQSMEKTKVMSGRKVVEERMSTSITIDNDVKKEIGFNKKE